jgi:hypothetical protein
LSAAPRPAIKQHIDALLTGLLDDLQPRSTLPGHDQRIVEWLDRDGSRLARQSRSDGFAVFGVAIEQHHPGAVLAGALNLDLRGIGGHQNGGLDTQQARRIGDALSVVAGRERQHTTLALLGGQAGELVEGTAKLERTGKLQHLRFDQYPAPATLVEHGRFQQWRAYGVAVEALGSEFDIRKGDNTIHGRAPMGVGDEEVQRRRIT